MDGILRPQKISLVMEKVINFTTHGEKILNNEEFKKLMFSYKANMGRDKKLRSLSLELQQHADEYKYTYQQECCGVPVIRLPDDMVVLQEIIWSLRPNFIIETGVARGGSLVLSASFMSIAQLKPNVLGLDIKILEHTSNAIADCPFSKFITFYECDSASDVAAKKVGQFISSCPDDGLGLLILDSDHTHKHVYKELETLSPLLPMNSFILIADTLIDEMPPNFYTNRPWGPGNSPLTAVNLFLSKNSNFERSHTWSRRGLISEFRDGILQKVR